MTFRKVKIPFFLISTGTLFTIWFFNLMMSPDSFVAVKEEDQSISVNNTWEEYLEDLDRRNDVKMKENYDDLMQLGVVFTDANNFRDAATCYWWAKTIYPYKEEPRRFLSEAYMNLCATHGEYCGDAKKEIYFAFRHINEESKFYSDILDMATALDLYPYLDMHESDVLPIFFEEKRMDVF